MRGFFGLRKVKVPVRFSGTQGFPARRDGRYFIAIFQYTKALQSENHIVVVVHVADLLSVSIEGETEFCPYASPTRLLLLAKAMKILYRRITRYCSYVY